ncbi:hypothetical protein GCM10022261_11630 [Brevibacterium daeguense]|uniref:Cytochrome bc1 complex Rieske iron-sulfur subunit n=1 Tax=Brevibacterium daeguense TaxID=909936 RepID=A0ABP8EI65_9MICO|nr:Rieske (2Fe-2S) protein [Brevibacterium daeguense]
MTVLPARRSADRALPDRRRVLQAAGIAGGLLSAGATAACSSGSEGDGGSGDEGSGDGDSGGEELPTVTVPVAEVPVGSGIVVENTYAVVQPAEGEFHAFSAVCTHEGCLVQNFTPTEIVCPCHSSRFSTTDGTVISGPASTALAAAVVTESDGELTISPA